MSQLPFDSVLNYCHMVHEEALGRPLYDGEIAALHCAWDNLTFKEYIKNQKKYIDARSHLYRDPNKIKKIKTLPASSSRVLKVLTEQLRPYLAGSKISKSNFRVVMESLFLEGKIEIPSDSLPNKKERVIRDALSDRLVLYGRYSELEAISNNLDEKSVFLIWGYPGVGKTHLIRYFFHMRDNYVVFRDARSIDNYDSFVKTISNELNLDNSGNILDDLISFSKNKKLSIIIDSIGDLADWLKKILDDLCVRQSSNELKFFLISRKKQNVFLPLDQFLSLHLKGFEQPFEFNEFFNSLGLKDQEFWPALNEHYEGNPRQLIYVSKFINDYFGGSTSKYLGMASIVISPDLVKLFSSIQFTDLDIEIFNLFSGENKKISIEVFDFLKAQRSTSEIFSRIGFLEDHSFLTKQIDKGLMTFAISPLLKRYLIEEGKIEL